MPPALPDAKELLNLTRLKIFALQTCPGTLEEKADILFDLCLGKIADIVVLQILRQSMTTEASRMTVSSNMSFDVNEAKKGGENQI